MLLSAGNAGSLLFNRELTARYGQRHGVVLGEMEGNLYPCRRTAPATVIRAWPLSRRRVAAFPACDTPFLIDALQDIMEAIPADNILEAALNAPNVTTHLMASLLNLSSIEQYGDDFCLYRDGLTPSVVDMVQRLIEEKARLFNKLGWQQRSSTTLLRKLMAGENAPGLAIFRNLGGPTSATHRYLTEDASTNLSLLWHLGELADTPMPLSAALLTLAGALHGVDYFQQGLKPEDFGWASLSLNDILHILHEYPSIN